MLSIDTETTGIDFAHGTKPFFVTTCNEKQEQQYWEWSVDPLTRQPIIPDGEFEEIRELIFSSPRLILQNAKFDVTALAMIDPSLQHNWPWEKTEDTLIAAHLLSSNTPHDLTSLAVQYLSVNIQKYEDELEEACNQCRRLCRSQFPEWLIAKAGLPCMPSAKEKCWKADTWLPRAVATKLDYPEDHPYWTVLSDYANVDTSITVALWLVMEKELKRKGLYEIYKERMKVIPVAYKMERYGVTCSATRLQKLRGEYIEESGRAERVCVNIAEELGYALQMPKSGNNKSLSGFLFGVEEETEQGNKVKREYLKLPVLKRSDKTGAPSLDAKVMEEYTVTLPTKSLALSFITNLRAKRKRDTALSYMEGYERFWVDNERGLTSWLGEEKVLHPSLNPTGTHTLRWSSNNPNEQNISKQEGFNLRYIFGPAPGREWWSCDAKNIELRLPAYEAGETAMIELFERPDDAPYFGSNHLLIAHVLWPKEFNACKNEKGEVDGRIFKKKYADTLYQWTKNGNFAVQYGAIEQSGTADRAYHQVGAQRIVQSTFTEIDKLNKRMIRQAEQYGYVETIPDKTVNPKRGYPLLCTRTDYGKILPTVPLNYHVQGTACWWMMKAMIRCEKYLEDLRSKGVPVYLILQVHDEVLFDFPKGKGSEPWKTNHKHMIELQKLMEEGGKDIGIPTPVSCEYHAESWAEGRSM